MGSKGRSSRIEWSRTTTSLIVRNQRAAGGRADVGHESQLRGGQAPAEQRDGHHRDATQHHDLPQHWALMPGTRREAPGNVSTPAG
jgi:hypothetical protein